MKTPEELAAEWLEHGMLDGEIDCGDVAPLIRARDAEHEALRREERGKAFDAGAEAGNMKGLSDAVKWQQAAGDPRLRLISVLDDPDVAAARRAAVEGAGEPASKDGGDG